MLAFQWRSVVKRHWGLRKVNLGQASGVWWRGLAAMVRGCPLLESMDLSHLVGVWDQEMEG